MFVVLQLQNCCCYAKSWWTAERYSHFCICISMARVEKDKALFHPLQWAYTSCCSLQVSLFFIHKSIFYSYCSSKFKHLWKRDGSSLLFDKYSWYCIHDSTFFSFIIFLKSCESCMWTSNHRRAGGMLCHPQVNILKETPLAECWPLGLHKSSNWPLHLILLFFQKWSTFLICFAPFLMGPDAFLPK